MPILLLLLAIFPLISCTNTDTINLKQHRFAQRSKHIIWFMVPGLHEEHISLLKVDPHLAFQEKFQLEDPLCFGKLWSFNLFKLRPHPFAGHLAQATGTKNVNTFCDGLQKEPIWNVFAEIGHKNIVLESAIPKDYSFELSRQCKQGHFLSKASLVRMHGGNGKEFHYQREGTLNEGDILYDKSCQKDICFASFSQNAKAIWNKVRTHENIFFVLRIGNYRQAIENGNILQAKKILKEIDELIAYFMNLEESHQFLILASSSGAKSFEFPERGRQWAALKNQGKNIVYKKTTLMSPVWASGPGAENFCGIYEESEIFNRILWRPQKSLFEEKIRQKIAEPPS